jgi:hypothetical protein
VGLLTVEESEEREKLYLDVVVPVCLHDCCVGVVMVWLEENGGCGEGSCLEIRGRPCQARHFPLSPDQGQVSNHTRNVYTISTMIVLLNYTCK